MSEKQMYFKVQFDNWDSLQPDTKNLIQFYLKDAFIYTEYFNSELYDNPNFYQMFSWSSVNSYYIVDSYPILQTYLGGLIPCRACMTIDQSRVVINDIAKINNRNSIQYLTFGNHTITPIIDGKVNNDISYAALPNGNEDQIAPLVGNYTYDPTFVLRTSSFNIFCNSEPVSVHYKIGICPINEDFNFTIYTPPFKNNSHMSADEIIELLKSSTFTAYNYDWNGNNCIYMSADTDNGYITVDVSAVVTRIIAACAYDSDIKFLIYMQLCKDETGEQFEDITVENSDGYIYYGNYAVSGDALKLYITDQHLDDNAYIESDIIYQNV